jgi:hypothetical protein
VCSSDLSSSYVLCMFTNSNPLQGCHRNRHGSHDDTNGALLGCVFVAQLLEGRLCGSQLREDGNESRQRVPVVNVGLVNQSFECLPAVFDRLPRLEILIVFCRW